MAFEAVSATRVKQEKGNADLQWQPELDGVLMQLFYLDGCWDLASVDKTHDLEVLTKLQSLEALIPAFEARINHSDDGFRAWKRLHQFEMEAGRAQFIQMFVKMVRQNLNGEIEKVAWADEKWEIRYAWIVRQREELARIRFDHIKQQGFSPDEVAFYGRQTDRPSRIIVLKGKKTEVKGASKRINENWCLPIDGRLMNAAGGPGSNYNLFREAFWGRVLGRQPILPESRITGPELVVEVKLEDGKENVSLLEVEGDKENVVQVKIEEGDDHHTS